MASNEHAFLSEANLHNPKGLSLANNNSVCSKDNSGLLAWKPNSFLKVETAIMEGYCDLTANYQFPSNYTNNNKAPYQINRDYGSATITSTPSIAQNTFFKVASFVAAGDAVVNGGILQVIASGTGNFTVAIVKHTPSTTAQLAYPVVLSEKIVAGLGNINLVNSSIKYFRVLRLIKVINSVHLLNELPLLTTLMLPLLLLLFLPNNQQY